jgi:hypothetical protein
MCLDILAPLNTVERSRGCNISQRTPAEKFLILLSINIFRMITQMHIGNRIGKHIFMFSDMDK